MPLDSVLEYDHDHEGYVEVVFVDDRGHVHYLNVLVEFVRRATA